MFQLSPTGRWVSYLSVYRPPPGEGMQDVYDLAIVPASGGTPEVVADELPVPEDQYYLQIYIWHPSRDRLYWVRDGGLWMLDLADDERRAQQLGGPATLTEWPLALTRDGQRIIAGADPLDRHDYRDPYPQAIALIPADSNDRTDAAWTVRLPPTFAFEQVLTQAPGLAWQPHAGQVMVLGREYLNHRIGGAAARPGHRRCL